MSEVIYLTEKGLENLKRQLSELKDRERPFISRQIAEARDKGDLSENAEYVAAKEAQGMLELKISQLENKIANARLVNENQLDTSRVQMLNRVKILNKKTGTTMEYVIVPDSEADLKAGKISVSSPIAQGLMGRRQGDSINIQVPSGIIPVEIKEISI